MIQPIKLFGLLAVAMLASASTVAPHLIAVRHVQGDLHGFLALRSLDGTTIGDGDLIQAISNDRIVGRTVFHFRDGSVSDETAVFTQNHVYRLISDHVVQSGPAFSHPLTMDIDVPRQRVTVHFKGEHGEDKVDEQQMALPADICNGVLITLMQDMDEASLPLSLPYVAATPSPRMVTFVISKAGTSKFFIGASERTAANYLIRTDIGGLTGLLARVFGKQPPDAHVWVLRGDSPAFVKSEAPMSADGPVLRTELTSPQWPK